MHFATKIRGLFVINNNLAIAKQIDANLAVEKDVNL